MSISATKIIKREEEIPVIEANRSFSENVCTCKKLK